jgi:AcrR family transcriptional regulator
MGRKGRSVSRGPGRPVGADSVATRARILRGARQVINERGYQAATFMAIAKQSGLSRPTLHYYFRGREDLYEALIFEAHAVITECIQTALQHDTVLERFSGLLSALDEQDRRDRSMVAFLVSARLESRRNPGLRDDGVVALRSFLTRMVEDAIVRREISPNAEIAPIVELLHAILWGIGFYAGFVTSPTDRASITKQLYRLFAHGLLGVG